MNNNVLFVDDELHILKALKRGLYKEPYTKFFANSPEEALRILEKEDIHVIVSDMKMPGMTGLELLTIVKEKYPKIVKIILSGYTQLQQIIVTINRIDIYKFITKPWDMETEFKAVIINAIAYYNTKEENERLKISVEKKNELYQHMLKKNLAAISVTKRNFSFLGKLNRLVNKYVYDLGIQYKLDNISSEQYEEEAEFVSHLMEYVTNYMPATMEQFNKQYIENKVNSFISKEQKKSAIEVKFTDTTNNKMYIGQINYLIFILSVVAMNYYDSNIPTKLSMVLSEKQEAEISYFVVMILSKNNQLNYNSVRLDTMSLFFECLTNDIEGTISFENKGEENLFLIKIPLENEKGGKDE